LRWLFLAWHLKIKMKGKFTSLPGSHAASCCLFKGPGAGFWGKCVTDNQSCNHSNLDPFPIDLIAEPRQPTTDNYSGILLIFARH
jgi:hypothetical protein